MAKSALQSMFVTSEKQTEEEIKKEKEKLQEKLNPFKRGPGCKQDNPNFGYSITPEKPGKNNFGYNGQAKLVVSDFGASAEKHYFYFINFFTSHEKGFFGKKASQFYKLKDVFDASVTSAYHGQIGTKVGAIQGQVSTYLTQIGQLTKTLLPMVREIRMMDERLAYYKASFSDKINDETARQNEITLKSTWVEVVEQGMQNPNSVYSMATKLGFVTLPDLFFGTSPHGKTPEEQLRNLSKSLEAMHKQHAFTSKLRNALEKKLTQYYTWKAKTYQEMSHTWKFRLKALKQHYNVIRLYTSWLKPYLTTLKALQLKGEPDAFELVGAFETSKLELELLAVLKEAGRWRGCILVRITYTTRPDLHYTSSGQRQPMHAGKITMEIEPYIATQEDIDWYKKYADKEVLKYISGGSVDFSETIEEILSSLGSDVEDYILEAETGKKKEEVIEEPKIDFFYPLRGFIDSFKMFIPDKSKRPKKPTRKQGEQDEKDKGACEKTTKQMSYILYEVYKKQNGMLTPL